MRWPTMPTCAGSSPTDNSSCWYHVRVSLRRADPRGEHPRRRHARGGDLERNPLRAARRRSRPAGRDLRAAVADRRARCVPPCCAVRRPARRRASRGRICARFPIRSSRREVRSMAACSRPPTGRSLPRAGRRCRGAERPRDAGGRRAGVGRGARPRDDAGAALGFAAVAAVARARGGRAGAGRRAARRGRGDVRPVRADRARRHATPGHPRLRVRRAGVDHRARYGARGRAGFGGADRGLGADGAGLARRAADGQHRRGGARRGRLRQR